jgi:hypothetical protein
VVEYLRGNVEAHASCLETLAAKEKPARAAQLNAFVAKARDLSKDVRKFSALCENDRALTLVLFCAKCICSRPLSEMEFDCHGDVVVSQTAAAPPHGGPAQHTRVVRQLEFKRADVSAAGFRTHCSRDCSHSYSESNQYREWSRVRSVSQVIASTAAQCACVGV